MIKTLSFDMPTTVPISKKKKFSINLNIYSTTYFGTRNTAKQNYAEIVKAKLVDEARQYTEVLLMYKVFPKTKRRLDVSNVCSIADKFISDALVDLDILEDDSFTYVKDVIYSFGEVDNYNPRVEIRVVDYTSKVSKLLRELEGI